MSVSGRTRMRLGLLIGVLIAVGGLVIIYCSTGDPAEPGVTTPPAPTAAKGTGVAALTPAGRVHFVDTTASAGIRFHHVNGATPQKHMPETYGSGCAFLDYDGDGWLDVLLINGKRFTDDRRSPPSTRHPAPTAALYRNDHDGTFTDVTRGSGLDVTLYGMGCCAGDYDNDGRVDLYVTCALEPGRLFHNETPIGGPARFRDVTAAARVGNESKWGTSCAWLDDDRDGWLDLFIGNYVPVRQLTDDVRCRRDGVRVYCSPTRYPGETSRLYRNTGHGGFLDVTRAAGIGQATARALGVLVWDYNEDHWPDVMVASDQTRNLLFENLGRGTFREVGQEVGVAYCQGAIPAAGMGIDAADIRNEGRLAVAVSNFESEPMSLFYARRPASFEDVTYLAGTGEASYPFVGFGTLFVDYENSGWRGLFVANGHVEPEITRLEPHETHAQRKQLFRNRGPGAPLAGLFEDVTGRAGAALMKPGVGRGAARGDYDNDGDLDLLVTNNGGPAQLLRNEGGNRSHWLALQLTGTTSNRDGIGAVVTVEAGGVAQRDWVRSGGSYLSQSDLRLHFGLGTASTVDSVEIRWPSGRVDRLGRLAADRVVAVRER